VKNDTLAKKWQLFRYWLTRSDDDPKDDGHAWHVEPSRNRRDETLPMV
jgi:hypothetical protein